jgi:hypothetical protein
MNNRCDLTVGPCACGAWHSEEEVMHLIVEISLQHAADMGPIQFDRIEQRRKHVVFIKGDRVTMVIPGTIKELDEAFSKQQKENREFMKAMQKMDEDGFGLD